MVSVGYLDRTGKQGALIGILFCFKIKKSPTFLVELQATYFNLAIPPLAIETPLLPRISSILNLKFCIENL